MHKVIQSTPAFFSQVFFTKICQWNLKVSCRHYVSLKKDNVSMSVDTYITQILPVASLGRFELAPRLRRTTTHLPSAARRAGQQDGYRCARATSYDSAAPLSGADHLPCRHALRRLVPIAQRARRLSPTAWPPRVQVNLYMDELGMPSGEQSR